MPWEGVTKMDQRVRFISEYLEGYFPVAEIVEFQHKSPVSFRTIPHFIHNAVIVLTN